MARSLNLLVEARFVVGKEAPQVSRESPAEAPEGLLPLRAEGADEQRDAQSQCEGLVIAKLVGELVLVVQQECVSMTGECHHQRGICMRVAVFQPVAKADEEAEVGSHGVCLIWPALSQAALKLPSLRFAVNPQEAVLELPVPVPVVDAVPDKLSVQKVEPGKVHVDYEALEGPGFCGVVVEPDGKACLLYAGGERCLPSGRTCHT